MTMNYGPRFEPAKSIYSALVAESEHRHKRCTPEWIAAERQAVFDAAVSLALVHGLREPTLEDILAAERSACGHTDYMTKFALYVAEAMKENPG